jgi:hypothetical protein
MLILKNGNITEHITLKVEILIYLFPTSNESQFPLGISVEK